MSKRTQQLRQYKHKKATHSVSATNARVKFPDIDTMCEDEPVFICFEDEDNKKEF